MEYTIKNTKKYIKMKSEIKHTFEEKLIKEVEEDMVLNPLTIKETMYKIPQLVSKYQRILFNYRNINSDIKKVLDKLYTEKYHYYKHDYDYVLDNKALIDAYVYDDEDFNNVNEIKIFLDHCIKYLESITSKLQFMQQDIKNIIEYEKYLNGD